MKITFGANGEIVDADFSEGFTDPGKEPKYTTEEKQAAAATVPASYAKVSPQQLQIDSQVRHIEFLEKKANAVTGYDKDGVAQYVETAAERAKLMRIAAMERQNVKLSAQLAEMSLGEDALHAAAEEESLRQQMADAAALEERARAIQFEAAAQERAKHLKKK